MTVPEILKELDRATHRLPVEALKSAITRQEEITPELLRILEDVADHPTAWAGRTEVMSYVFALYLLAQFREQRAYPLVIRIISHHGRVPSDLFGDLVTVALSRILGSVYDGDPAPIQRVVENPRVDEYVRSAAADTFLVLEQSGQMPRAEVLSYFRALFQVKLERTHSFVWDNLVLAVADMRAPELLDEIRRAYAEDLVYPGVVGLAEVERDLVLPPPPNMDQHRLITDCVAEMQHWAAFNPAAAQPSRPAPNPGTYVRDPKVGRNDPCPCGSGAKFKKCCGKAPNYG